MNWRNVEDWKAAVSANDAASKMGPSVRIAQYVSMRVMMGRSTRVPKMLLTANSMWPRSESTEKIKIATEIAPS